MIFESENGNRIVNIKESDIEKYLKGINGTNNSYAVLEANDGSYIQVGGGPVEFTVEVRKDSKNGDFCHLKAKKDNFQDGSLKNIIISGLLVEVKSNQILDLETVILLFNDFYNSQYTSKAVFWDNITNEFQ